MHWRGDFEPNILLTDAGANWQNQPGYSSENPCLNHHGPQLPDQEGEYIGTAAANRKERSMLGMLAVLAGTPWLQFNPISLMNANKGVFGVNLGHMWGEIDRMREWAEQVLALWRQGVVKPKVARSFRFDEAAQAHHFIQDRKNIGKVLLVP